MIKLPTYTDQQQGVLGADLTDEEARSILEHAQIDAGRLPVGRHVIRLAGGNFDTDNPDHTVVWFEFDKGLELRLFADAGPAVRLYGSHLWRRYVRGVCQFARRIQATGIDVRSPGLLDRSKHRTNPRRQHHRALGSNPDVAVLIGVLRS